MQFEGMRSTDGVGKRGNAVAEGKPSLRQLFCDSIVVRSIDHAPPFWDSPYAGRLLMKYCQLDRITSLDPGKRLTAERTLHAHEDFLADHFPRFPVMPGVMMLEALHQAAVWMIKCGDNFRTPLVLLREARGVKFGDFLAPGETLEIAVEAIKEEGNQTTVKATASKQGRVTVTARLVMERCGTNDPSWLASDEQIRSLGEQKFRELFGDVATTLSSQ